MDINWTDVINNYIILLQLIDFLQNLIKSLRCIFIAISSWTSLCTDINSLLLLHDRLFVWTMPLAEHKATEAQLWCMEKQGIEKSSYVFWVKQQSGKFARNMLKNRRFREVGYSLNHTFCSAIADSKDNHIENGWTSQIERPLVSKQLLKSSCSKRFAYQARTSDTDTSCWLFPFWDVFQGHR